MTWPPQSPDLSPIELLWDEVDRQVQSKKPTSIAELTSIVKDTWKEIAEDVLEKLLARMPLLCQAVIDAEGGYFNEKLAPPQKKSRWFIIKFSVPMTWLMNNVSQYYFLAQKLSCNCVHAL